MVMGPQGGLEMNRILLCCDEQNNNVLDVVQIEFILKVFCSSKNVALTATTIASGPSSLVFVLLQASLKVSRAL